MSNQKFNWKGLFIQENEHIEEEKNRNIENNTELESKTKFPQSINSLNKGISNEILSKVIEMYEKGFESLNQQGYDFFEFFRAIMATDPNNPQSYIMAYTMVNSMDNSINKSFLLNSADFYQKEILKVYSKFDEEGKKAKNDLLEKQRSEKEKLKIDIESLQSKIQIWQKELEQKSKLLQNFDADNFNSLQEIDQKILANDLSKEHILQKITQVSTGINNHI